MKNVSFLGDVLPLKNKIYRLALRITLDSAEAEDIVQETLMKVWERREDLPRIDSIEAFSLAIAHNLALNWLKRSGQQSESFDEEGTVRMATLATDPYEQIVGNDRVALVKRIVDRLPEKQRSCMQLRDFEGKPYKEIAQILGISEEQVKVNIFRARQTVKQQFTKLDKHGL
ncbi:MAG: RNA polymerase sigma factor [Prevotella sp.]|nr:RNA polymerase sigma factor [Prevotella sp.]